MALLHVALELSGALRQDSPSLPPPSAAAATAAAATAAAATALEPPPSPHRALAEPPPSPRLGVRRLRHPKKSNARVRSRPNMRKKHRLGEPKLIS